MSTKSIIIEESAIFASITGIFHLSFDYDVSGKNSNLCPHIHSIKDFSHMQKLRQFWFKTEKTNEEKDENDTPLLL